MTTRDILRTRLRLQHLAAAGFESPADVVRHFGAMQAQDYLGALWAVGQRMKHATEASVEEALTNRSIVRSWPMRGTLHFVLPEDLRWMIDLLAPRIIHKSNSIVRGVGLRDGDFVKARKIVERILQGGKQLDRTEIYEAFSREKLDPGNTRGLHILVRLAMQKVICFGPRRGKQQTFVLLDEWIPGTHSFSADESLAAIAWRYYSSHGPATVYDLAWWTGLNVTEATRATDMVANLLERVTLDERVLYVAPNVPGSAAIKPSASLIPAFDEYLVSYEDRSDSATAATRKLTGVNSIFVSTLIYNGSVVGNWKRTLSAKGLKLSIRKFEKLSRQAETSIERQCRRYASFLGVKWIG